jgi:hypothetical protein
MGLESKFGVGDRFDRLSVKNEVVKGYAGCVMRLCCVRTLPTMKKYETTTTTTTIIKGFWDRTHDYPDWHTGTGTPIPKTTRVEDTNQFRIINLMDVCSKIFSGILTSRTYKILEKHRTNNQFGATRNVKCQDGNFTLKT